MNFQDSTSNGSRNECKPSSRTYSRRQTHTLTVPSTSLSLGKLKIVDRQTPVLQRHLMSLNAPVNKIL